MKCSEFFWKKFKMKPVILVLVLVTVQGGSSFELNGNITGTRNLTKTDSPYTVTSDVIVTKDASLNVEPGVKIEFASGVGLKVHGTLKAQGNSTSHITLTKLQLNETVNIDKVNGSIPYNEGVRLHGGANYRTGRLEIFIDNQWTSICRDYWSSLNTQVACRMLGFLGARTSHYLPRVAANSTQIGSVRCKGTEKSLLQCPHRRFTCHYQNVGIECYTLLPLLGEKAYWSGIEYKDTANPVELQYVDIHKAYIGIRGHKVLPPLYNVTITSSIKGIKSEVLKDGFSMRNTLISGSMVRGMDLSSNNVTLTLNNSIVCNTTSGDGIEYSRIRTVSVDLSEVDPENVSFPLYLTVYTRWRESEDTIKVFKTLPDHTLALNFQFLSGQGYYIEARDGDNINSTLLVRATQTDSGHIVSPAVTTGNVLWLRYHREYHRYSASSAEFLITESTDKSSLTIMNSKVTGNNGFGLTLNDVFNQIHIENTEFSLNSKDGMMAKNITGILSGSKLRFNRNSANGLVLYGSSISFCHLSDVKAFGNQEKGILLQMSWTICSITNASLVKNNHQGLQSSKVSGLLNFTFCNISGNRQSGIDKSAGAASVGIYYSYILQNGNHGIKLKNQGGVHSIIDSFIEKNKQHGIFIHEIQSSSSDPTPQRQLSAIDIQGTKISNNLYNGVYLSLPCQHIGGSTENVSILIMNNSISNNNRGGVRLSPESCSSGSRYKKVSLIMSHSELRENKNQAFYIPCIAFYRLKAEILNNSFQNNSDQSIVITEENNCWQKGISTNPVEVIITQNQFIGNRGNNLVYIDFKGFSLLRKAMIKSNTFQNNTVKFPFPNLFQRTTDKALVVFKEGTFALQNNSFDANDCRYLLSTLYVSHSSIVHAEYNWWDTKDECTIRDKIFDFYDRIQLAKVKYFPFFLSSDDSELAISRLTHMDCFLNNNTIGGALDGELFLPRSLTPYKVRDDILVLENGSLRIPSNTTLMFPARAAMMVQGELHVTGNVQEKVNFVKDIRQENIRLSGGQGPWEGVLQFYLNNSWIPVCYSAFLVDITGVCRHLGYIERYLSYEKKAAEVFLLGIKCLDSNEDDIVRCKNKSVAFGKNCYLVSVVYCTKDYWAGVHLAFTKKKSELHHLNIDDAGFNYRSDINIPGYALRVDFDHHNFSNINIRSSSGLGIQVLFPSPFMKKSFIPKSKISDTASHGIQFGSPYLKLIDVEVEWTRAAGFRLYSQWDSSTSHATQTMAPSIKKIDDICAQNITYLKENDIVYLYSALPYNTYVTCQHLFATEQGRRLGIHVLHLQLYRNRLHAFDGNNITASSVWKIETFHNRDRKAFSSSNNEVLLLLEKGYYSASFHLILFSIKEEKTIGSFIEIENSKFSQTRQGLSIYGNDINQLRMINCSVSNSGGYLTIEAREIKNGIIRSVTLDTNKYGIYLQYSTGVFGIYSSSISQTRYNAGINMYSFSPSSMDNLIFNLFNCTISHGYQGLVAGGYFSRGRVVVQNSTFESNKASSISLSSYHVSFNDQNVSSLFKWNSFKQNQGVTMQLYFCIPNTDCTITENSFDSNAGSVITISSCGYSRILISQNLFSANQCRRGAVISLNSQINSLEALHNVFEFNQGTILLTSVDYNYKPLKILFNIFKNNNCTGASMIEIRGRHYNGGGLVFSDNIFERNIGEAVLSSGTHRHCYASFQLKRNVFRNNLGLEKSVIYVIRQRKVFEASENYFHSNAGASLIFGGADYAANLLFADNSVQNNTCISREMVSILRMDGNVEVYNNTFYSNKAMGMMSVQSLHNVNLYPVYKSFAIINNTFAGNQVVDEIRSALVYLKNSCVLKLRGLFYYKITKFYQNKFSNPSFSNELCLRVPGQSQKDIFNASHNWWGTSDNYLLRKRIFDFDDNHDFVIASTTPFLASDNDNGTIMFANSPSALLGTKLGGRVRKSLFLTEEASPYKVISDLTILPGVVLTIEPNVELRFSPGASLLVIGTLIARGTKERKVKFTLDNPPGSLSIRLKDGHFPWEGRLEVYHKNKWMPVCCPESAWNPANTKVICKELGYLPHHDARHIKLNCEPSEPWPYNFTCFGNESSMSKCNATENSFASNATEVVGLNCKGEPWGNIGFVTSNENGSVMESSILEHVEIRHCGKHSNSSISAVESVMRTPKMKFIAIQNCSSDGFSYFLPNKRVSAIDVALKHLHGNGINLIQSSHGITIKDSTIEDTIIGVDIMDAPQQDDIPSVHYGRLSICDSSITTIDVNNKSIVFFELNDIDTDQLPENPQINCQKEFKAYPEGKGVSIRLLFYRGSQTLQIYDKRRTHHFRHSYPENSLNSLLLKELIFPEIAKIRWYGNVKSRVLFEVNVVDIHTSDIPCNFQYGLCGWQSFRNMTINGINMTTTWMAAKNYYYYYYYYYRFNYRPDNSFYSDKGYVVGVNEGNYWQYNIPANASLVSPLLASHSKYCKLVFYYKFGRKGNSSLNVFVHKGADIFESSPELRLLWKPMSTEVLQWRKVVLNLPKEYMEYRIIFLGTYKAATSRNSRNFVILDDVHIQKCATEKPDVLENNVIINNEKHGIFYNSTSKNPLFVKRNKVVQNVDYKMKALAGGVNAVIKDTLFLFTNNHISGNTIGGVHVQTENSDGHPAKGQNYNENWIYGNSFIQNGKEALQLVSNRGVAAITNIKENFFSSNYGKGIGGSKHNIVKTRDVPIKIEGNFFFNNSGLAILNYEFLNDTYKGQQCTNNTFIINTGTEAEYGTTIRTNGPMQYHGNNFKNPHNLYEIDTTTSAVTNPVNATENWLGFGIRTTIKTRIRDQHIDKSLPRVLFEPFIKIQPRNILSLGCPFDWMDMGSTCYVFRAGVQSFQEADEYCKYYGGHILSSSSPGDKEVLGQIKANITPTSDQPPRIPIWIISDDVHKKDDGCQVLTHEGKIQQVSCNSHYSFACSRNAVIRCPNGCSHNGDCIGSTCFCYRGWTGEDCSKHHCRDVHNCSDAGECIGPNVCRCKWSFRGRACTYSYCSKLKNCSSCVSDQFCGWCDNIQQCLPGDPSSPHKKSCPDWFYYNCYTVGSENHCSDNIWRVDCQLNQCNFERHSSNMESCAKCKDLENCYNFEKARKCRAWNITRCPHGMVQVDYSNQSRINNTQLRSNVKVIDPRIHTIYSCPVVLPGENDVTSVFVVPEEVDIKVGHVMTSPQAGGVMHKVNQTDQLGPYTVVFGEEAELNDVIEYADFQVEVQPDPITDAVTEEENPNKELIDQIINGSVVLNNTKMHILQGEHIYKCVGHLYQIGSKSVVSHYLVMEAVSSINANPGDFVVANESHGFIEQVANIRKTETATFIHTMLERCNGNSTWTNNKLKARLPDSDDTVVCSGGDNNPGLIISDSEDKISVNDSIIGRRSQAIMSKVISSSVSGDYVIMEVLPVTAVVNGTAVTEVPIDQLHVKHRRAKRGVNYKFPFVKEHINGKSLKLGVSGGKLTIQESFEVSNDVRFKFAISREKGADGKQEIKDVILGIEIKGRFFATLDLELSFESSLSLEEKIPIVPPLPLGMDFCIPVTRFVCVKSGFVFELNLISKIIAKTTTKIHTGYTLEIGNILLGGTCSFNRRGCDTNTQTPIVTPQGVLRDITTNGNVLLEIMVAPKLSFKLPVKSTTPSTPINNWKNLWKRLKKINAEPHQATPQGNGFAVNVGRLIPGGLSLFVEFPYGVKMKVTPCFPSDQDHKGNIELNVDHYYGSTRLTVKMIAGIFNWEISKTLYNLVVHNGHQESFCAQLYPASIKDKCQCQTTTAATTTLSTLPTTESLTKKTSPKVQPTSGTPSPSCKCLYGQTSVFLRHKGVCRCLPTCKDSSAPVKVGGFHECPQYPACGNSPNCVIGRKGPSCSQPDFYPCTSECSGNGLPLVVNCFAWCSCFRGWAGTCCSIRVPIGGFGDPHLQTLDGIEFDYFGIGEFWGCRSIYNSFGLQFRFFAHKGTSLIGGIALRVGKSVVSVMSRITSDPKEMPHLRIDGSLVNLTKASGSQLLIDNQTARLEVQKQSDVKNEGEVVFFSLEYKKGVTVTIYVRHSSAMGRQFLNALYTLNAEFKGRTQGICGLMDNNPANDLTGPNGELYSDPLKFADSWRISATRNISGFYDSWSWNASNFHVDDVMDSSYTDPSHVPTYELSDVPSDVLEKSKMICQARKLPDNLMKSCIYDVAATNDTSFAMQEALQIECPDQCSGKGRCVKQTCECLDGWTGEKCEIGYCKNCSNNGNCVNGYCRCKIGWQGETCSEKATCYDVNNCTSSVHGICKTTNKCLCNDGYMGHDCSIIPTCLNVSSCSGHGKCVNFDVCKCDRDWTGKNCSQYSCSELDFCSGHGRCVNVYQCECQAGWTGVSCAIPDCPDVYQCNGNGTCIAPNKCKCYPGYSGSGCLDSADCSMLANCSDHGACVTEDGKNFSCRCYAGFRGIDCSQPTCNELNNCSNRGVCKEAGFCECDVGFSGSDCSNASCQTLNYCSGHGECIDYDVCKCEPSWHGAACSIPDCTSLNDCSKQGVCLAPNKCECYPGYDGIKCDKPATPNYFPPVFSSSVYNVSVHENATLGSFVGQVNASDLDQGRNGEVLFFLTNDVGGLFTVEGDSGKIFTSSSLRYDVLKTDLVILDVRASDNGKPMKFASCKVFIEIIDVNDFCPIFDTFIQTSYNISINTKVGTVVANVSALDKDNGVNGDVRYLLGNGNGIFSVDWSTGVVRVMHQVQLTSYHVVVIARDQGTPSCSSSIKLVIKGIVKEPLETTADSEISSTEGATPESVTISTGPNITHGSNITPGSNITLSSANNSLLKIPYVVAGSFIGICLLAIISTIIICLVEKGRLKNANNLAPKNKRNTSRQPPPPEVLEGEIPDFQDIRGIEMRVWSSKIPVNVPAQETES